MYKAKKITRNDINKEKMVALSYCQIQHTLNLFAYDYKIGYNSGVYGWNYDLYDVNGTSVVTGYNVPYRKYNNQEVKKKLIALESKLSECTFDDYRKNKESWKKEFLKIFE